MSNKKYIPEQNKHENTAHQKKSSFSKIQKLHSSPPILFIFAFTLALLFLIVYTTSYAKIKHSQKNHRLDERSQSLKSTVYKVRKRKKDSCVTQKPSRESCRDLLLPTAEVSRAGLLRWGFICPIAPIAELEGRISTAGWTRPAILGHRPGTSGRARKVH